MTIIGNIVRADLDWRRSFPWALLAGAIAIAANIALLSACDAAGVVTARGGFQKLVKLWLSRPLVGLGADRWWDAIGLPVADTNAFMLGFKIVTGLVMALLYAVVIEPKWPTSPWRGGLVAAGLFWMANACVVLPLLGQGFAGSRVLSLLGLLCFGAAHTAFFLVLAWFYAVFRRGAGRGSTSSRPL